MLTEPEMGFKVITALPSANNCVIKSLNQSHGAEQAEETSETSMKTPERPGELGAAVSEMTVTRTLQRTQRTR